MHKQRGENMTLPQESILCVEVYLLGRFEWQVTEYPSDCALHNTLSVSHTQRNGC